MIEPRKVTRIKTQGDRLVEQLDRQKSIFKNLRWQDKQKDRKISFLQRYYAQLQQMIAREKKEDSLLMERAQARLQKRKGGYVYRSDILKMMRPSSRRRLVTQAFNDDQMQMSNQSDLLTACREERSYSKK